MQRLGRRRLLAGSALFGASALCGCKAKTVTCPPAQLSPDDLKLRDTLKYTDHSPDPAKLCNGCQQYVHNPEGDCGGCKLFKGPVHPAGYCVAFAAKS
jgi:hypothetical protein